VPRPKQSPQVPAPSVARLESRPARTATRGVALFCHGGTVANLEPPRERALSLVRMRAIEQYVHDTCADRGIGTYVVRYRVAGWNGAAADAYADVRWSLDRIREEHGRDVPGVRTVAILHGRGDRWVPAALSADFAVRAQRAGARVARFTIAGGHSMLRRAPLWHAFARDVVLAGTGIEPMRPDVEDALRRPAPEGLAVPL